LVRSPAAARRPPACRPAALDALVDAHLEGPARELVLESFHTAVDEYFALAVPEPSTLLLAALALPLVSQRQRAWARADAAIHNSFASRVGRSRAPSTTRTIFSSVAESS
jgi:hypothetical protein